MSRSLISLITFLFFNIIVSFSQNIQPDWINNISGASENYPSVLKVDQNKNSILFGVYKDSINFDPSIGDQDTLISTENFKSFLVKYDSLGGLVWFKDLYLSFHGGMTFGDIAIDSNDNIYLFDSFRGDYQINDTTLLLSIDPSLLFIKFNTDGEIVFFTKIDPLNNNFVNPPIVQSIEYDNYGSLYLIANNVHSALFNLNNQNFIIPEGNTVIMKIDTIGDVQWMNSLEYFSCGIGGAGQPNKSVFSTIDNSGKIILSGTFCSNVIYSNNNSADTISTQLGTGNEDDVFLLKLNENGSPYFFKLFGGGYIDRGGELSTDEFNNIYSFGTFSDSVVFDSSDSSSYAYANGVNELYLLKLDEFGEFIYVKNMGYNSGSQIVHQIVKDGYNNLFLLGGFSNSEGDFYLLKLNDSGEVIFKSSLGHLMCIDNNNSVYLSGGYYESFVYENDLNEVDSIYCALQHSNIFLLKTGLTEINQVNIKENILNDFSANVYPNPFNSEVLIQSTQNINSFRILDILGNVVVEKEINSSEYKLNTQNLGEGMYFIQLKSESNVQVIKIIKN